MLADALTMPAEELPAIRAEFHDLLDRRLNIDAAAAQIQGWSDKLRGINARDWKTLPPASQELYKLLTYRVICQLVEGDPWELLQAVDAVLDRIKPKGKESA